MKNANVHIALFSVSLFYAILFSWAGQIMPNFISAEAFVWMRIIVAGLLFQLLALGMKREKIDYRADWKLFLICAFFGTAANMYLFFKGLSITNPINGAVLMMVTPLFVAVFDHIKEKRIPGIETVLGLIIGSAGATMLIAGKGVVFNSETILGDIFVAINAAFYAVYLVLVKKLVHKYSPVTVNKVTFGIGILLMAPLGFTAIADTNFAIIPTDIWLKIGYTLLVTSFLVYLLNAYGIKHGSPSLVGLYIYLQPLLATVIALVLGTDTLTPNKIFWAALIVFGVWLVLGNNKRIFSIKEKFISKK